MSGIKLQLLCGGRIELAQDPSIIPGFPGRRGDYQPILYKDPLLDLRIQGPQIQTNKTTFASVIQELVQLF